jgi:hypothetical protein
VKVGATHAKGLVILYTAALKTTKCLGYHQPIRPKCALGGGWRQKNSIILAMYEQMIKKRCRRVVVLADKGIGAILPQKKPVPGWPLSIS